MLRHPIITLYLIRLFSKQFLFSAVIVVTILVISNIFDNLQKFKSVTLSLNEFWLLIIYKIPFLFNEVSILIGFFATILYIQSIRKNNELIIILSNGIPIGRVFLIPFICTFIYGLIILAIVNPLGTYGLKKYRDFENKVNNKDDINFIVSQSGIFFYDKFEESNRIIQVKSINTEQNTLHNLTILIVDSNNNFIRRIDSVRAVLDGGMFKLFDAVITDGESSKKFSEVKLPTNLTIKQLSVRFSPPEMINFYKLNDFIKRFAESGLSVMKYRLYYFKQLFGPLAAAAMSSVACWFISLNIRSNSNSSIVALSLILGMTAYFFLSLSFRILAYNNFSPFFATLLPVIFIILISNFVILHFQEA